MAVPGIFRGSPSEAAAWVAIAQGHVSGISMSGLSVLLAALSSAEENTFSMALATLSPDGELFAAVVLAPLRAGFLAGSFRCN